jgi:DNA polymerase (family 10)
MDWRHWRRAAEKGLRTSINPDAHSTDQLGYFHVGVGVARKGWLTKQAVLNTRTLAQVRKLLKR